MGGANFPAAGTTAPESGQPDHPQFIVKATGSRTHLDWDTNSQFIDIQQYLLD
jgi:hypothetical protein